MATVAGGLLPALLRPSLPGPLTAVLSLSALSPAAIAPSALRPAAIAALSASLASAALSGLPALARLLARLTTRLLAGP
jgi:hypothetical protein